MKKIFTVALILASFSAMAKDGSESIITVQSGKIIIKLDSAQQRYLVSRFSPKQCYLLRFYGNVIKNNDTADLIISVLNSHKNHN